MTDDRMVAAAAELMKLGVSRIGIVDLLGYPIDVIERQLAYLPHRKCRRPEAFIVQAIRHDYSAPNKHFHAKDESQPSGNALDQGSERAPGPPPADAEGHGTPDPAGTDPSDLGMESRR